MRVRVCVRVCVRVRVRARVCVGGCGWVGVCVRESVCVCARARVRLRVSNSLGCAPLLCVNACMGRRALQHLSVPVMCANGRDMITAALPEAPQRLAIFLHAPVGNTAETRSPPKSVIPKATRRR